MTWLYRSLLFLAIAMLFVTGFLELNRIGALGIFEMTGRPGGGPPTQIASSAGTADGSSSAPSTTTGSTTTNAAAGTRPAGTPEGGPSGERDGGFQWAEVGKDLALVVLTWLALAGLDRLVSRRDPRTSARS